MPSEHSVAISTKFSALFRWVELAKVATVPWTVAPWFGARWVG